LRVSEPLPTWERPRFEAGGADAFLLYVLYGEFAANAPVSRLEYRTEGLPAGVEVRKLTQEQSSDLPFIAGEIAKVVREESPEIFDQAVAAPECLMIKGAVADPPNLNYLRDTIGMIAWWFDHGAVAALDVQRLKLYEPTAWWLDLFAPFPLRIANHVVILASEEAGGTRWLHTRGMRKFGRPDLSIHRVGLEQQGAVVEMINRFIAWQAEGGRVAEGQEIRIEGLPGGMTCHHCGSVDDPYFNNSHLEIRWPGTYSF
jgi:hypothetical protein